MAIVIGDVYQPEILADAIMGYVAAGIPVMGSTGAARLVSGLPASKAKAGETVKVPYFGSIGEFEDVANDGDGLTPASYTDTSQNATVVHSGKLAEITAMAAAAGLDPVQEIARQMTEGMKRRADKALVDAATANVANAWDAYTHDASTIGDGKISYDHLVEARGILGDESEDLAAWVFHSKVEKDLRLIKDAAGLPVFTDAKEGGLPRCLGIPVLVSDRVPLAATVYTNLLLKRDSLVFWMADITEDSILTDTDISKHTQLMALHMYFACHRYTRMSGMTKPGVIHLLTK